MMICIDLYTVNLVLDGMVELCLLSLQQDLNSVKSHKNENRKDSHPRK